MRYNNICKINDSVSVSRLHGICMKVFKVRQSPYSEDNILPIDDGSVVLWSYSRNTQHIAINKN